MRYAFTYVKDNGLGDSSVYPYEATDGACRHVPRSSDYFISGYKASRGCDTLLNYMLEQPVSVALDGNPLQNYKSGVLKCPTASINHAVLLVGTIKKHWIIKNSWGANWGENGFGRIHKTKNCGICLQYSVPLSLSE